MRMKPSEWNCDPCKRGPRWLPFLLQGEVTHRRYPPCGLGSLQSLALLEADLGLRTMSGYHSMAWETPSHRHWLSNPDRTETGCLDG